MGDFQGGRGGKRPSGRGFGGGSRGPRSEGGAGRGPRREGGFSRGPRSEGGEGGYKPRSTGGYKPRGEGGFSRGPRRDGEGFKPRGEGGYKPREGGFSRGPRSEGGEGGYKPRSAGGYKPRGEGGFSRGPRRDGEGGGYKPRGEGGFSRGPRREGGYKPRGEGGYAPREGGYGRGPRRDERTFDAPQQDDAAPMERTVHGKQTHWVEKDPYATAPGSDGWLVGKHAVQGAIRAGRRVVKQVLLAGDEAEVAAFTAMFPEVRVTTVKRADLDSRFTGQVHQGIAAEVGNLPQPDLSELLQSAPRLLVGLDQVTDPHNFGAILRSCAAFGVGGVIATERRSAGVTSVVAKAAAGALEIVPAVEVTNLANALKDIREAGYTIVGLAGESDATLASLNLPDDAKMCIVLGSEGEGLRRLTRENCDQLVRIPMSDAMESLNVSVAAGVILGALYRA